MIKVHDHTTEISGELGDILSETTHLLNILYKQMKQIMGEEKANEYFAKMGMMATLPDEKIEEMMKDES